MGRSWHYASLIWRVVLWNEQSCFVIPAEKMKAFATEQASCSDCCHWECRLTLVLLEEQDTIRAESASHPPWGIYPLIFIGMTKQYSIYLK